MPGSVEMDGTMRKCFQATQTDLVVSVWFAGHSLPTHVVGLIKLCQNSEYKNCCDLKG